MGEEAEALSEMGWDEMVEEDEREARGQAYLDKNAAARKRYDVAKRAETGATIKCAWCSKLIVKKTYHKVFCSNQRTHGKNNCKDRYHNNVVDDRRHRAQVVAAGINPNSIEGQLAMINKKYPEENYEY